MMGNDTSPSPGISVVVPVYNSEATLCDLILRVEPVLRNMADRYEVVLVNDGSSDGSWRVIQQLSQAYGWVRGIALMRNYGQHNALLCGIRAAKYEILVTIDDDLQHPPEEIPKLVKRLAEGHDVVYGTAETFPHSLWRNLLSRLTKFALARTMGIRNIQDISAFRAFRTDLRGSFAKYGSPNVLLDVLLSWGTTRFGGVHVRHEPRRVGKSNYSFAKLFNQAVLIVIGFSTTPLRLASLTGFAFSLIGVIVLLYVIIEYILVGSLPGFPFLASIVSLFSGVQLFSLGIMGEYLARMFNRSMERPTYVIRESLNHQTMGGDLSREPITHVETTA